MLSSCCEQAGAAGVVGRGRARRRSHISSGSGAPPSPTSSGCHVCAATPMMHGVRGSIVAHFACQTGGASRRTPSVLPSRLRSGRSRSRCVDSFSNGVRSSLPSFVEHLDTAAIAAFAVGGPRRRSARAQLAARAALRNCFVIGPRRSTGLAARSAWWPAPRAARWRSCARAYSRALSSSCVAGTIALSSPIS